MVRKSRGIHATSPSVAHDHPSATKSRPAKFPSHGAGSSPATLPRATTPPISPSYLTPAALVRNSLRRNHSPDGTTDASPNTFRYVEDRPPPSQQTGKSGGGRSSTPLPRPLANAKDARPERPHAHRAKFRDPPWSRHNRSDRRSQFFARWQPLPSPTQKTGS